MSSKSLLLVLLVSLFQLSCGFKKEQDNRSNKSNNKVSNAEFDRLMKLAVDEKSHTPSGQFVIRFACKEEGKKDLQPVSINCSATPICEDNGVCYFLTAAHCLYKGPQCGIYMISYGTEEDEFWGYDDIGYVAHPEYVRLREESKEDGKTSPGLAAVDVGIIKVKDKCPFAPSPLSTVDPNTVECKVENTCIDGSLCRFYADSGDFTKTEGSICVVNEDSEIDLLPAGNSGAGLICEIDGKSYTVGCYVAGDFQKGKGCLTICSTVNHNHDWINKQLPEKCRAEAPKPAPEDEKEIPPAPDDEPASEPTDRPMSTMYP